MTDSLQPVPPVPTQEVLITRKGNGFGIAALILGILSFVGAFIPFLNYGAIFMAVVGLALGIVGLIAKNRPRGGAIAGVILSALGLILSIIMVILYTAVFFGVSKAVDDQKKEAAKSHSVVYTLSGDSTDADVTYSTENNGTFGEESANGQTLPFTKTITVKGSSDSFTFNDFTLTGINGTTGTTITCAITLDGKTIATQTSTGQFASVTCSGSN
jgi:hypothetical protein